MVRPLIRPEQRRVAAHSNGGQGGNRPLLARRSAAILYSVRVEEFVALFVLGMFGGIAVVLMALFVL